MRIYKNTILPALMLNYNIVVVEYYNDYFLSIVYEVELDNPNTNISDIVNYHKPRCTDLKFFIIHTRELFYKHDHIFPLFKKFTMDLLYMGIDDNKIKFITNYHSFWITNEFIKQEIGIDIDILKIRYFELEAILKHSFRCLNYKTDTLEDYNNQKHQSIDTLTNFDKKYLALFGKPIKYFRIGTLIEMNENGMFNDSISTALVDNKGSKIIVDIMKEYFEEQKISDVLSKANGSYDNIYIQRCDTISSHYSGYPYDGSMYEDTFMSIIAECHFSVKQKEWVNNQDFWLTEKTARVFKNFHPFVMLSTDGFLKRLRDEMGYMTFHEIVDESYDTERDGDLKIKLALNSAKGLVENYKDPRIREIVTHNYFHQQKVAKDELKKIDEFIFNKYRGTVKTKLI